MTPGQVYDFRDRRASAILALHPVQQPQGEMPEVKADLRGPFRIYDASGTDLTPKGMKERAMIALLLLSPGQKRTRVWLQDKLWSDRPPEQAAVSFRQALTHVRKALGPLSDRLKSDRSALWLDPRVPVPANGGTGEGEMLDDLDVRDPEFDSWLRDLRQGADTAPVPTRTAPQAGRAAGRGPRPVVVVQTSGQEQTPRGQFLGRAMGLCIVGQLSLQGDVEVILQSQNGPQGPPEHADARIEIETLGEDATWYVLMRAFGQPSNRVIWTGRLRLPMRIETIWESHETNHLVTRAVSAVTDHIALGGQTTPFSAIQRAVRRVYDFDKVGLESADALLREAQDSDLSGLALAWRGFVRLTSALEFRDTSAAARDEALSFCAEALKLAPRHPVVLALSAQVQMKLNGDHDQGLYLAQQSAAEADRNPYALDALSTALFFRGEREKGHSTATLARQSAEGLAHSFSWDMQCCLSALSLDQHAEALEQALAANRKMPAYRPALRYLVALHLLDGAKDKAEHYARRLKAIEPDFDMALLLSPDYPIDTLRALGHVDRLRDIIG